MVSKISHANISCISAFLSDPVQSSVRPLGSRSARGQPAGSWCLDGSDYFSLMTESVCPVRGCSPIGLTPLARAERAVSRLFSGKGVTFRMHRGESGFSCSPTFPPNWEGAECRKGRKEGRGVREEMEREREGLMKKRVKSLKKRLN